MLQSNRNVCLHVYLIAQCKALAAGWCHSSFQQSRVRFIFLLKPSELQLCHSKKIGGGSIYLFSVTCRVRDYFIWKYLPLCECNTWETSDMKTYRHVTALKHWPSNLWPPAGSSVRSKLSWPHPNLIQVFPFSPHTDLRPPHGAGPYLMFIGSLHFIFISHLQALLHEGIMLQRPQWRNNWVCIYVCVCVFAQ